MVCPEFPGPRGPWQFCTGPKLNRPQFIGTDVSSCQKAGLSALAALAKFGGQCGGPGSSLCQRRLGAFSRLVALVCEPRVEQSQHRGEGVGCRQRVLPTARPTQPEAQEAHGHPGCLLESAASFQPGVCQRWALQLPLPSSVPRQLLEMGDSRRTCGNGAITKHCTRI